MNASKVKLYVVAILVKRTVEEIIEHPLVLIILEVGTALIEPSHNKAI